MKKTFTTILTLSVSLFSLAQTQIANPGFENWGGNPSPGVVAEPTGWFSNKSGSSVAKLGPQICFQDNTVKHTGNSSVRLETNNYLFTPVNGAVTTGVINAPNTSKVNGYIGTVNFSSASDVRRTAFTGRPDSIVGWYQYTSGGSGEKGKVTAILHNNDYFDPETPTTNHPDPTADKIARATFFTPTANVGVWTRFSAPFIYSSAANPSYIMVNMTCSENQVTTVSGSKMWIDDILFIYNNTTSVKEVNFSMNTSVYYFENNLYVNFGNKDLDQYMIELYDVTGQLVLSQKVENSNLNAIDVSSLNTGVYMYKLNGKTQSKVGKLFID